MIPRICAAVECSGCERRGPTPANGLTSRGAYYNEHDPKAAAWIRELIKAGVVAPGEVDERSIVDVRPDDLVGFTQCHFFAGIAVWSYALRLAGWPDDRPVWTGSCPCQPFSAAGQGKGFADERHLWPVFHRLIDECRPPVVFGEQVASKAGLSWFDAVHADLEGSGYAVGAADLCAAGVGAPHIRQRLYFVANADRERRDGERVHLLAGEPREGLSEVAGGSATDLLAHAGSERRSEVGAQSRGCGEGSREEGVEQRPLHGGAVRGMADTDRREQSRFSELRGSERNGGYPGREKSGCGSPPCGFYGGVALSDGGNSGAEGVQRSREYGFFSENGVVGGMGFPQGIGSGAGLCEDRPQFDGAQSPDPSGNDRPSPTNGFWRDADWLFCRDGKWRPVKSGSQCLASGSPARMVRLRGYGNSIVAPLAAEFIQTCKEYLDARPE